MAAIWILKSGCRLVIAQLKLETRGGAVGEKYRRKSRGQHGRRKYTADADEIGGVISVASSGGGIDIGKAGGDVQVATGGGNIHIGSAAGRIIASSGGGNLNIGAARLMTLQTGAGSIKVVKCSGRIKAETGGGSIDLSEIEGPAQIETGGGGIHVGPIRGGLHAETGSGPIIATLAPGTTFTDTRLRNAVGDIIVYVPDGLGVTVRAAVEVPRGQGILSDFPELKITPLGELWRARGVCGRRSERRRARPARAHHQREYRVPAHRERVDHLTGGPVYDSYICNRDGYGWAGLPRLLGPRSRSLIRKLRPKRRCIFWGAAGQWYSALTFAT